MKIWLLAVLALDLCLAITIPFHRALAARLAISRRRVFVDA
jgi:hypothetical protein